MSIIKIKTKITQQVIIDSYFKGKLFKVLCDISELGLEEKERILQVKILSLERLLGGHKIVATLGTREIPDHHSIVSGMLLSEAQTFNAMCYSQEAYLIAQLKGKSEVENYFKPKHN